MLPKPLRALLDPAGLHTLSIPTVALTPAVIFEAAVATRLDSITGEVLSRPRTVPQPVCDREEGEEAGHTQHG